MDRTSPAPAKRSLWEYFLWAFVLLFLGWAWRGADIRPGALVGGLGNAGKYAAEFFPPDFRDWRVYLSETLVTVHIALWGTLLAVACAVPCGLLSAENIAPAWVRLPMRRILDACRAINEMVFAMLFIVVVGLGPFAGVLALWVHTTGSLGKLFAEAVEASDPRPVEGVRAVGASALEEILYGVLPQVLPLWTSYALYRLEANIRSASVVGMVGAGGIGVVLYELLRSFQYAQACAVLILIVLLVSLTDWASSLLRRRQI
ncbi:MAG: phosphonate ABC transporter, permease protein PhnE [Verrucomicrobia bacterium]|nr:phosphonate ABC transporter, permease protein PhnE [Verrucomicrobiota bacterium]